MLAHMPSRTGGEPTHTPPGPMPPEVEADLAGLDAELDRVVPLKSPTNLLIGTWNVRALGGYNDRWTSRDGRPVRCSRSCRCWDRTTGSSPLTSPRSTRSTVSVSPMSTTRHAGNRRAWSLTTVHVLWDLRPADRLPDPATFVRRMTSLGES